MVQGSRMQDGEQLVSRSEALCCSFWCSSEFTGYSECILTDGPRANFASHVLEIRVQTVLKYVLKYEISGNDM